MSVAYSFAEKFGQWAHNMRHLMDEKKMKQKMKRIIVFHLRRISKERPSATGLQRAGDDSGTVCVFCGHHAIAMDNAADDAIVHG